MARWLIQLDGERRDLEEFKRAFPDGDMFVVEEDGAFYLTGPHFEALGDAGAVRDAAIRRLPWMSGVMKLTQGDVGTPTLGGVHRQHDDGRRDITLFPEAGAIGVRGGVAALTLGGLDAPSNQPTYAQRTLAAIEVSASLTEAVTLWSQPPTWPRLYRILEALERHIGQDADKAHFCSAGERTRFTRTANSAEVSGLDARHAAGSSQPPLNPMTLRQATEFIRRMLIVVIGV